MLKVTDRGYLELDELPEIERRVKLFEDVSTINGDFSYSFSAPTTKNNVEILSVFKTPTNERRWAKKIPSTVEDDSGVTIYSGYLRVQVNNEHSYDLSFFSGNSNWIDELAFDLADLDWSKYDQTDTQRNFDKTSGVVMPLVDNGLLRDRQSMAFATEEFVPYIYVKDVFKEILNSKGIKLTGDILNNVRYNNMITSTGNGRLANEEIQNRHVYIGKSSSQSIGAGGGDTVVTFTDTAIPYYNSVNNNWDATNSRYVFDLAARRWRMHIKLKFSENATFRIKVKKNGVDVWTALANVVGGVDKVLTERELGRTKAGDYVEVTIRFPNIGRTIIAGSSIEIQPIRFYKVFAKTILPEMTCSDFMSNIFSCLNTVVSYSDINKTLTANCLDNVLISEPIDLSKYVRIVSDDYEDFVSDYSKNNALLWGAQSNEFVERFNRETGVEYGSGNLQIDNDFLEDSDTLIEMDFDAPFQTNYPALGLDLPFTDFLQATVLETRDITSVSDVSGLALFNHNGDEVIFTGVFRISECSNEAYNGTYYGIAEDNSAFGLSAYDTNATGKIEFLQVDLKEGSNPVLLIHNPSLNIRDISGAEFIYAGTITPSTLVSVGNFIQAPYSITSLSFESLIDSYFRETKDVLNNGYKSYAIGNIPSSVYRAINFMRTVRVNESVYYLNSTTGYKGSKFECTLELIKIK